MVTNEPTANPQNLGKLPEIQPIPMLRWYLLFAILALPGLFN